MNTPVQRKLDRVIKFDERSRNFPIRATFKHTTPRSWKWKCDIYLDQGTEGACTGFAVSHEAIARPCIVEGIDSQVARDVYHRAQQIDEWPGEDYEGSSVLAAMKAGKERGWYKEYRWAFGVDDLAITVSRYGPAVLGIYWYTGMFNTDNNGYIHATGSIAGGHAILCNGFNVKQKFFKLHNSWGRDWGLHGECKISYDDMNRLLQNQGEACIPVLRTKSI